MVRKYSGKKLFREDVTDKIYDGGEEDFNQVMTTNQSIARARMVQDVYEAMTSAKFRKENRSLSTRAKN